MQFQAVKRLRNIGNRSEKRVLIHGVGKKPVSRQTKTDRTTRLLIAILFLFLITEFPQVIYLCYNQNIEITIEGNTWLPCSRFR